MWRCRRKSYLPGGSWVYLIVDAGRVLTYILRCHGLMVNHLSLKEAKERQSFGRSEFYVKNN